MGVEHFADWAAGDECRLASFERIDGDLVHLDLARRHLADGDRAHQSRMVVAEDAGEFERQLVVLLKHAAAGMIAAQRFRARADDEFVGRVVAIVADDDALHGEDLGAMRGPAKRCAFVKGKISEMCRFLDIGDLGG